MIAVGLDIEATGLDKVKDRPIELALTRYTTKFNRGLESRACILQSDGVPVTPEITEITGINQEMCDKQGLDPKLGFEIGMDFLDRSQAIVAFNGRRFDVPMMHQWAKRLGTAFPDKFIIDPYEDLPATNDRPSPGMRPQELITMCAKEGIYYDPHEAGADVGSAVAAA